MTDSERSQTSKATQPIPSARSLPRVKDLTQVETPVAIEIEGSGIYDMLLTMWSAFDPDEDHSSFELGKKWFSDIAASVSPDLREEIKALGGPGDSVWLSVGGLIAARRVDGDIDHALDWLASVDPFELRLAVLTHKNPAGRDDSDQVRRAAAGDADALEAVLEERLADKPEAAADYRRLLEIPGEELRERLVTTLTRFRLEAYKPFEIEFSQATRRAAEARRALTRGADPERVIEEVTNGLEYRIQPGVTRLVLVPSVVLRPWAVIDKHSEVLVVAYPVADEFLDPDPDAPPSWIVKLHKALGDERRLRILRRLSEGGASLDDLAELLGLSKSTVHHHVGLLRGAGLIRVVFSADGTTKHYALRAAVLPEAARTLDTYIRIDTRSQS